MNIKGLRKELSKKTSLKQQESEDVIRALFDIIKKKLVFGEDVTITNFGKFSLEIRQPRKFKDLQTNEFKHSKKKYFIKFKTFNELEEKISNKTIY